MKKLLSILVTTAMVFSCSSYEDRNFSAIEQLVGEWTLQNRSINNNLPLATETESLFFSEDNKINDYKGNYELVSDGASSGVFNIDTEYANLVFTTNSETTTTYRFYLNNISMVLTRTDENGDVISDTWVKTLN
ncbi:MAG: hypothetical protein DA407_17140 [Bacteroidetes bacterium]|jgi:hypothetical protein|nr:MAG: hypothetical protein DA407_17140 [Bacteroidota bacterium]